MDNHLKTKLFVFYSSHMKYLKGVKSVKQEKKSLPEIETTYLDHNA